MISIDQNCHLYCFVFFPKTPSRDQGSSVWVLRTRNTYRYDRYEFCVTVPLIGTTDTGRLDEFRFEWYEKIKHQRN